MYQGHPKDLSITDFSYDLPAERIAFHPAAERDASKLLVFDKGNIAVSAYRNLPQFIPPRSFLVFNNTRVVEARLLFQKPTGGLIEIFCLAPHEQYGDITNAMNQVQQVQWLCLIGGASKWKPKQILECPFETGDGQYVLRATYLEKRKDCFVIRLEWNDHRLSFAEVLHHAGLMPLPPYIKRQADAEDALRYQTLYAKLDGSVAAPTAGLHFTEAVLQHLEKNNVKAGFVTLHVGAGTFKPVVSDTMKDHEMHTEFIEVAASFIMNLKENLVHPVVAVGTTSLRTLETLYWLGVKLVKDPNAFNDQLPFILQWEIYETSDATCSIEASLQALLHYLQHKGATTLMARTAIIIAPGYIFKIVKGLVTNFHQPRSTLLLLVAAFIGADWKTVYQFALDNDFRFLSYGDGSLLWLSPNSFGLPKEIQG